LLYLCLAEAKLRSQALEAAREDARRAVSRLPRRTQLTHRLARLLLRLDLPATALDMLEQAPASAKTDPQASELTYECLNRLGLIPRALDVLAHMGSRSPGAARRLCQLQLDLGDPHAARDALGASGTWPIDPVLRGRISAAVGDVPGLLEALSQAEAVEDFDASAWIPICLGAGLLAPAQRLAVAAGHATGWEARLALWRLDRTEPGDKAHNDVVVTAGRAVADGDPTTAIATLAAGDDLSAEAHVWYSEACFRVGRYAEGVTRAHRAQQGSSQYALAAACLRLLCTGASSPSPAVLATAPPGFEEILPSIRSVIGIEAMESYGPETSCETVLLQTLERLGGNRTTHPIRRNDRGELEAFELVTPIRNRCRQIQMRLRTRGMDAALDAFDALEDSCGPAPVLHTYRGELLVWQGQLGRAEREFRRALTLDRRTKWAWIGLGACALLAGDLGRAFQTWNEGLEHTTPGPTLYVYRGEAHRRAGQLEAARSDLAQALATSPKRVSTKINLALLASALGNTAPAETLVGALPKLAPGFLEGPRPGAETPTEAVARLLGDMRGNRSSAMPCWFDAAGAVRHLKPERWRDYHPLPIST